MISRPFVTLSGISARSFSFSVGIVKKGLEIVAVGTVDELLKRALTKELVPIEWSEEDEKAAKPAKTPDGEEAVVTH
jgi:hypothetical protein